MKLLLSSDTLLTFEVVMNQLTYLLDCPENLILDNVTGEVMIYPTIVLLL
jgi:hypothetical protein